MSVPWLVLAGLFVHVVFFYSIFDIYFTSPLVHGMPPHAARVPAPAKRLVLFVADGLRADKLFGLDDRGMTRAPFLRDVTLTQGAWGVSHTRVPTESRPGHVALIAGFYEDVSAVGRGWKENPVDFDSLFNESRYTWSWGSPDILPMFAKGASGDHVFMKMYPAESEDFAGDDSSKLDTWVFDQVQEFLGGSHGNASLQHMLRQDKVVFFLHLLGIDCNGHSHRPYSEEYLRNIGIVDDGVKKMVSVMEDYFGHDGRTAYVLTADHGMTNWGSHGAGHPSETLTPLVAWGAGVRKPKYSTLNTQNIYRDGFQDMWKLTEVSRADVQQADISPLMASLIGVPFPLNSVGLLPVDYLDIPDEHKAENLYTNALQIAEQFEVKMRQRQKTTLSFLFRPFKSFTIAKKLEILRDVRNMITEGRYNDAMILSRQLIEFALEGLNYYQNYDRFFLGVSITLGFVGWMLYVVTLIIQDHTPINTVRKEAGTMPSAASILTPGRIKTIFLLLASIITLLLLIQSLPVSNYVYCLLPVALWYQVALARDTLSNLQHFILSQQHVTTAILTLLLGAAGLEIIVLSFFRREVLSLGLLIMSLWPFTTALWKTNKLTSCGWFFSCLLVAIFPIMPVVGRDANYLYVYLAGFLAFVSAAYCIYRKESKILPSSRQVLPSRQGYYLSIIQLLIICVTMYIVWSTSLSISQKQSVPILNHILSWTILGSSFVLPVFGSSGVLPRLLHTALAFVAPYLLMSSAQEGLFYLAMSYLMFYWLLMENKLATHKHGRLEELDFQQKDLFGVAQRQLIMADLRCAYFFIFFIITAFFGTGNIASINSFDISSVYCFLTVFSPFTMGTLLMWKVLIPFLVVTCAFHALHVTLHVPTRSLFLLVLLMSDFMALHFFFLVRDYGSWLEIGTSISHYVIVMCTIIFIMLLLGLAKIFTTKTISLGKILTKTQKDH